MTLKEIRARVYARLNDSAPTWLHILIYSVVYVFFTELLSLVGGLLCAWLRIDNERVLVLCGVLFGSVLGAIVFYVCFYREQQRHIASLNAIIDKTINVWAEMAKSEDNDRPRVEGDEWKDG